MKVYNKSSKNVPKSAVYIGRGSAYGNSFVIGRDGNRAEVIAKHEEYVNAHPIYRQFVKDTLAGKSLVCHCAPLPCHGDTLLKIANEGGEK